MTFHPDDLRPEALVSEFEQLADDIAARPSAVNFDRAMAAGRRSVRNRRALTGLSGLAALGLAALIAVPAVLPGPVALPPATISSSPTDPLTAQAEFGWLPNSLTGSSHTLDPLGDFGITVAYDPKPIGDSGLNTSVALYTWPRNGSGPVQHSSLPGTGVTESRIGTLNGYAVERYVTTQAGSLADTSASGGWLTPPVCEKADQPGVSLARENITSDGLVSVVWRTPSGDWADIEYNYVNQSAPDAAELMHMARTVTFDETPLTMPFQVSGLSGMQVAIAQQGQYQIIAPDYNVLQFLQDGVSIEISVNSPAAEVLQCGRQPKDPDLFASRKINGLDFTVYIQAEAQGVSDTKLTSFGTASEILDHITSYGPHPANWTTQVVQP